MTISPEPSRSAIAMPTFRILLEAMTPPTMSYRRNVSFIDAVRSSMMLMVKLAAYIVAAAILLARTSPLPEQATRAG